MAHGQYVMRSGDEGELDKLAEELSESSQLLPEGHVVLAVAVEAEHLQRLLSLVAGVGLQLLR